MVCFFADTQNSLDDIWIIDNAEFVNLSTTKSNKVSLLFFTW